MIVRAVMLAILEKFSSMLGKLNFIWATAVLLGGFASSLSQIDFIYVSTILVVEGIRIFGRRGELQTSYSALDTVILVDEGIRVLDGRGELHTSYSALDTVIKISRFLIVKSSWFLIEEQCSILLVILPLLRLLSADYGATQNMALQSLYWVSLVQLPLIILVNWFKSFSGIFHPEPIPSIFIWINRWVNEPWRSEGGWVLEVKEGYNLDDSQIDTLYRFLHNTYSRCVRGSIFDSSKITIVSYSVELLQSSNGDEQLKGARLLSGLVEENPRALERLRSIGTIRSVMEMLIDMLNWDSNEFPDKGIREAAAEIISNLVGIGRNGTLVMAAPNSMESIASLLDDGNQVEINSCQNRTQSLPEYPYSNLSKVGLCILKQLANDHDNRAKMGSNRGLLLKIITLTESNSSELHLKMLAIETLTSIARDQDFGEIIGCIDGVLHNLFSLFLMEITIGNEELVSKAGEALGFLSFDNNQNCEIMKSIRRAYFRNLIPRLISLLNDEGRGTYAARILRNLSAYLEAYPEANTVELNMIGAAAAQVVDLVTEKEGVHQEAAIGLAAQIFMFLSQADYDLVIGEPRARSLISTLLYVLQQDASRELPNIRRLSILLLIAIMRMNIRTIARGSPLEIDLRNALKGVMNTTSVLESYSTFSGTIGLRSDSMAIPFLARSAIELLDNYPVQSRFS